MTDILKRLVIKRLSERTVFDLRLAIIYALNVSDYIFTLILLQSGMFREINPLLSAPINNFWGFALKCLVPFALLLYLRYRLRNVSERQLKPVRYILNGAIGIYSVINIFHICWLILMSFYLTPLAEKLEVVSVS